MLLDRLSVPWLRTEPAAEFKHYGSVENYFEQSISLNLLPLTIPATAIVFLFFPGKGNFALIGFMGLDEPFVAVTEYLGIIPASKSPLGLYSPLGNIG